jgi:uncharacterized protein
MVLAAERGQRIFPSCFSRPVNALAMVAEVVHRAPCRFSDPARFSLAHGGKDRHPYPVPLKVYNETIRVLKSAVQKAKLGQDEEFAAVERLDNESRRLERLANGPSVEALIDEERARSHEYSGRSVFGWEPLAVGPDEKRHGKESRLSRHVNSANR